MNKVLLENKVILKEKRKKAKELAALVNGWKEEIDAVKEKVDGKNNERGFGK